MGHHEQDDHDLSEPLAFADGGQRMPARLALALEGLTLAAVKLRAFASGDDEECASEIGAMLARLRADLDRLKTLDDRCERMVLAEQLAVFVEELAASARRVRVRDAERAERARRRQRERPADRAASDVAAQGMRLAVALRAMGSPTISLAIH